MKKVGIVICNYNKKDKVLQCIQSVLEQKFQDFDLYVVDNASTDGSTDEINSAYRDKVVFIPNGENQNNDSDRISLIQKDGDQSNNADRIFLIQNDENLGGSGGFDRGLSEASTHDYQYLMCIDNDAMLDENAVGELVKFLDSHDDTGIAASIILNLENPDTIQNFGQTIDYQSFSTEPLYVNEYFTNELPEVNFSDAVPACSLMIRKSITDKIGFLPKDFYLYWDDTEWCTRVRELGYKVASVKASQALHAMGAKREDVSTFPTYYAWRNWIYYFILHTEKKRLPELGITFLQSIYTIQCEGYEGNRFHRALTVMAAYDDAIHGRLGKARDGIIGEIEKSGQDVNFGSASNLPEKYKAGLEMFLFTELPNFIRNAEDIHDNK